MKYSIREAGAGDLAVLFGFRAGMFASFCDTDPVRLAAADAAFFGETMARGEAAAWLAEDEDGTAVACCAVSLYRLPPKPFALHGVYAYVSSMWTEPEHRRRGLGGRLLAVAVERARERGASHVCLHASELARPLYESFGFQGTNEMRMDFCPASRLQ